MPRAKRTPTGFEPGDPVEWDASQGVVRGEVEHIVTKPTTIKGHRATASPEHPEVEVRSSKSGARAVHLPEELRPIKRSTKRTQ